MCKCVVFSLCINIVHVVNSVHIHIVLLCIYVRTKEVRLPLSFWCAFQKKKKIIDTSDAGFFTGAAMMQLRRDDLQNVVAVQCMDRSRKMIGSPLVDFK